MSFNYRTATEKDLNKILEFIKALAVYEKMENLVIATEKDLKEWLFEKGVARFIFALEGEKEVGFALYFYNYSTFLGRAGIYLEDLFVYPEYRGKGYGKGLLKTLARFAKEENLGRVEWTCLSWNTPSIDFYLSLGAEKLDGWKLFRLSGENISKLAEEE